MKAGSALGPDIDAVSTLLQEVADEVLLPRFARLGPGDVSSKATTHDPDDVVTVADHEAEVRLSAGLAALSPGSVVIGEEAAHANPLLLRHLDGDAPVWLVDPLDGTRNFVAGREAFGTMIAFVVGGHTAAAWILLPVHRELFVGERGAGTWHNGARVRVRAHEQGRRPRGAVHTKYMPRDWRMAALRGAAELADAAEDLRSAAVEYTDLLLGRRDFAVYFRLLPWDHAAPAFILGEAGGRCEHLDGSSYVPRSADQVTIAACDTDTLEEVRGWFR